MAVPPHGSPRELAEWIAQQFIYGFGDPEGVVAARIGAQFTDQTAGATTTLYVKKDDPGLKTGWQAVA